MQQYFEINGGKTLRGDVQIQGAKNEALPVIAATLLSSEPVKISNIPEILDVLNLITLLRSMGVKITRHSRGVYTFQADQISLNYLRSKQCGMQSGSLRGSVMIAGPLIGRFGKAYLWQPGGDRIGRRRLDTHLLALQTLGVKYNYNSQQKYFKLKAKNLRGNYVLLEEPSVTGTANVVMAAVLAPGQTTIYNAACEPYVQQLCHMLNNMGAKIQGIGSNLLQIEGVNALSGTEHHLQADMIEVGSFIGLAAMTNSQIRIKNVSLAQLGIIPNKFAQMGIKLKQKGSDILVPRQGVYEIQHFIDGSILSIYDHPWPGLTPDLLSIFLVIATQAKGAVLIHQKMFESRLFFADKLIDMGAQIIPCDPHRATIIGLARRFPLRGVVMSTPDIRAGVALLIAALSAEGKSKIYNIEQIDRGYENIEERLQLLGADIKRHNAN